jgi:hypothetical protein
MVVFIIPDYHLQVSMTLLPMISATHVPLLRIWVCSYCPEIGSVIVDASGGDEMMA